MLDQEMDPACETIARPRSRQGDRAPLVPTASKTSFACL